MDVKEITNLNIDKLVSYDLHIINESKLLKKITLIIRVLFRSITSIYVTDSNIDLTTNFVFFKSQEREDYNKLFESIYDTCNHKKYKLEIYKKNKLNIVFLKDCIKNFDLLNLFTSRYEFINGIYVYLKIINNFRIVNITENIKFNNLVVFSDVHPLENLLVQYNNYRGINTVTLQHGLYIDYENEQNINRLNYIEVPSTYVLVWGESSQKLFEKYNDNIKSFVCGKLTIKQTNKDDVRNNTDFIGVVLDIPKYKKYNQNLIDIGYNLALRSGKKIKLRIHPMDNVENYTIDKNIVYITQNVDESDFILGHTTSMIYELLVSGKKVFKMRSDVPSNEISEFLKFSNMEELEEKLSTDFDFIEEGKKYIKYIDSESKNRYKIFFDGISLGKNY